LLWGESIFNYLMFPGIDCLLAKKTEVDGKNLRQSAQGR
jgi:hypothetical protein